LRKILKQAVVLPDLTTLHIIHSHVIVEISKAKCHDQIFNWVDYQGADKSPVIKELGWLTHYQNVNDVEERVYCLAKVQNVFKNDNGNYELVKACKIFFSLIILLIRIIFKLILLSFLQEKSE
jgi:hypothetical protein